MGKNSKVAILAFVTIFTHGCASTIKLPLCPQIAEFSYHQKMQNVIVNRFVKERAQEVGVKIKTLSYFSAEFSGWKNNVNWIERNYALMLCAFNPDLIVKDKMTYIACVHNVPKWIDVLNSESPEHLLLDELLYKANCAIPRNHRIN